MESYQYYPDKSYARYSTVLWIALLDSQATYPSINVQTLDLLQYEVEILHNFTDAPVNLQYGRKRA